MVKKLRKLQFILIFIFGILLFFLVDNSILYAETSTQYNLNGVLSNNKKGTPVNVNKGVDNLLSEDRLLSSLQVRKGLYPVKITLNSKEMKDLFTPLGNATPELNPDQTTWKDVRLTDDKSGQVGGLVLNVPYSSPVTSNYYQAPFVIDISFDIKSVPSKTGKDVGNGFAIFNSPEIVYGQKYKEGTSLSQQMVPQMPQNQGMYSLGQAGGNFGAADMIGIAGGYVANRAVSHVLYQDNKLYGSSTHAWKPSADVYTDSNYFDGEKQLRLNSGKSIMNSFYTWPDSNISHALGFHSYGPGALSYRSPTSYENEFNNIVDGKWYRVEYIFDENNNFTMKIWSESDAESDQDTNPKKDPLKTVGGSLKSSMSYAALLFYPKAYLKITASTGEGTSEQYVKNVHGTINVASAGTTIAKKVDATGKPLENVSQSFSNTGVQSISNPVKFTKSDGSTWVLSHINKQTVKTDGTTSEKTKVSEKDITNKNSSWTYTAPAFDSSDIAVRNVNFVYRRSSSIPKPSVILKKDGIKSDENMVQLNPGEKVNVNVSLTNTNDGPSPWEKVYMIIHKPKQLALFDADSTPKVTELDSETLQADCDDLLPNSTKSISYILRNNSDQTINFYPSDIDTNDDGNNMGQTIYVYDKSNENIDTTGKLEEGSYYYDEKTLDGPYAKTAELPDFTKYLDLDAGNYVPRSGPEVARKAKVIFHYWDIDDPKSDVVMDPSKEKVPQKEINEFGPQAVTGNLGDSVLENLSNETPIVKQNGSAPAPDFKDYQYLGYYEYDGTKSEFHSYDSTSQDGANSNVETKYKVMSNATLPQSIAFIYRKKSLSGSLAMIIDNPNLDFDKHFTHIVANNDTTIYSMKNYRISIKDARNNRGLVLSPSAGDYQLVVSATSSLTSQNNSKSKISSSLFFADPTITSNVNGVSSGKPQQLQTFPNSSSQKLSLSKNSTLTISDNPYFGNLDYEWNSKDIHLEIPKQNIKPDKYQTKITWQLTNSIN